MIRWFLSTVMIAVVVAGIMIIYLSPQLRSRAISWAKEKNLVLNQRVKNLRNSLPKETILKQAKDIILQKDQTPKQTPQQSTSSTLQKNPQTSTPPPKNPPMQDQISEQDRKELEKILEQAQKNSSEK